jgi:hypothetical protein
MKVSILAGIICASSCLSHAFAEDNNAVETITVEDCINSYSDEANMPTSADIYLLDKRFGYSDKQTAALIKRIASSKPNTLLLVTSYPSEAGQLFDINLVGTMPPDVATITEEQYPAAKEIKECIKSIRTDWQDNVENAVNEALLSGAEEKQPVAYQQLLYVTSVLSKFTPARIPVHITMALGPVDQEIQNALENDKLKYSAEIKMLLDALAIRNGPVNTKEVPASLLIDELEEPDLARLERIFFRQLLSAYGVTIEQREPIHVKTQ